MSVRNFLLISFRRDRSHNAEYYVYYEEKVGYVVGPAPTLFILKSKVYRHDHANDSENEGHQHVPIEFETAVLVKHAFLLLLRCFERVVQFK